MSCNKCNFTACSFAGIVLSIVFAVIIGTLFSLTLITFIEIAVWIAFGLGVLTLIALIVGVFLGAVTAPNALSKCLITNTSCLLAATIGTIISAIVALSIVLNPALILVIIIVAVLAFFFALMVTALISLISCIVCRLDAHTV